MPSHSGSLLAVIFLWLRCRIPKDPPSIPQRMNGRMRLTAPMAQPPIHQRLIENDPRSDYSSVSCVPHIYGVKIHGYEEKRVG